MSEDLIKRISEIEDMAVSASGMQIFTQMRQLLPSNGELRKVALSQQEAEPVAERFNECVHGVTFNSECEQCSAECAAGLPPQSQKVKIDMGAAVMDRLIHVGYTNAEQIEYAKDKSEGEGAFYSDTEDDCVIPLYMLKVHAHRLGYPVAESSPSKPAALPQPVASVPQGLEEFIAAKGVRIKGGITGAPLALVVKDQDLRTWMAGHARVPVEPTAKMIDAGVAMALQVSVHGQGGWSNYVRDLYKQITGAAHDGK